MRSRRRTDPAAGRAALTAWLTDADAPPADAVATAVRFILEELMTRQPGHSVEVRGPPYGAVQCVAGQTHRRGTPPNVVEIDPAGWLALVTGTLTWTDALAADRLSATGSNADLSALLPLAF
jgi:hypothetical protein